MQIDPSFTDPIPPEPEDDTPGLYTPAARLAALLVETEELGQRVSEQELARARARAHAQTEKQHEALMRAASSVFTGALVGGALTTVGGVGGAAGALGIAACEKTQKLVERGGKLLGDLAGPAAALIATATQKCDEARAAKAGEASGDAQFDAEQRSQAAQRSERQLDQAMDFAKGMQEQEGATWQAILSRF